MYYITYYYLNPLSITDCNVTKKNSQGKTFFKTRQKKILDPPLLRPHKVSAGDVPRNG
jgi:hypothetical protein